MGCPSYAQAVGKGALWLHIPRVYCTLTPVTIADASCTHEVFPKMCHGNNAEYCISARPTVRYHCPRAKAVGKERTKPQHPPFRLICCDMHPPLAG